MGYLHPHRHEHYCTKPWGGEGTKGRTDQKEGFYGGPELRSTDEHPLKGLPTYGENQFPDDDVPEMRKFVLEYIDKVTELGLTISDAMSVGLGLEKGEVRRRFLEPEPVQLFRAFKYSAREGVHSNGIGEHSDFGFLTILSQNAAGLQVLSPSEEWVDVPVIADSFVVNGKLSSQVCPVSWLKTVFNSWRYPGSPDVWALRCSSPPSPPTIAGSRSAFNSILF